MLGHTSLKAVLPKLHVTTDGTLAIWSSIQGTLLTENNYKNRLTLMPLLNLAEKISMQRLFYEQERFLHHICQTITTAQHVFNLDVYI